VLGDADVGAQIRVQVTYEDGYGARETVTSSAASLVGNVNDASVGALVIVGAAQEDRVLMADTSDIADADGLGAFRYQWLRNGVAIFGAVDQTYVAGDADVNAQIGLRVQYTDGNGTVETLTAAPTTEIVNVNDIPGGQPIIIGTPTEDHTLQVSTSGMTDSDGLGAFSFQWLRNGVPIAGATGVTHVLGDADVGTRVSVEVQYIDGNGTAETLISEMTDPVENINDAPTLLSLGDQFIDLIAGVGPLSLGLNDVDNAAETLVITITSSNSDVAPLSNILLGGAGFDRTIEIRPSLTSEASYSLIVVTVDDGSAITQMSFYVATDTAFNSAFLTLENVEPEESDDHEKQASKSVDTVAQDSVPDVPAHTELTDALLENLSDSGMLIEDSADVALTRSLAADDRKLEGTADRMQARLKALSRNIAEDVEHLAMMNPGPALPSMELSMLFDDSMFVESSTDGLSTVSGYQFVTMTDLTLTAGDIQISLLSETESGIPLVMSEEMFDTTTGAVLTSVVAVGAVAALGKSTVVGALGTSTTTNSFLYLSSKGKLAATRSLQTIVGHLASLSGKVSIPALMFEHMVRCGGVKGASVAGGATLGSLASSLPVLCKFDALRILNDYAAQSLRTTRAAI
jgi:hypothetical protein